MKLTVYLKPKNSPKYVLVRGEDYTGPQGITRDVKSFGAPTKQNKVRARRFLSAYVGAEAWRQLTEDPAELVEIHRHYWRDLGTTVFEILDRACPTPRGPEGHQQWAHFVKDGACIHCDTPEAACKISIVERLRALPHITEE